MNLRKNLALILRAVVTQMEAATVWIVTEDDESIGSGSGFIVGEGYIATNAHVISEWSV